MSPHPLPRRYLPRGLLLLLAILCSGGCLSDELCTPADTTYGCCLKQHPTAPAVCSASEKEAARVLAVAGTVVAATTLSSDEVLLPETLQADVEKALRECASPEQRQALLRQGRSDALKGTLVPDVVIHSGAPLKVQAVYDFKFPCLSTGLPKWSIYDEAGHPYQGRTQGSA